MVLRVVLGCRGEGPPSGLLPLQAAAGVWGALGAAAAGGARERRGWSRNIDKVLPLKKNKLARIVNTLTSLISH